MVNQKLVYHVIVYEENLKDFVGAGDEVILVEFIHIWCKQHGLRPVASKVRSDHLHLVVEQRGEFVIQRVILRLISELKKWSVLNKSQESHVKFGVISTSPFSSYSSFSSRKSISLNYALFSVSFPTLDRLIRFVETQSEHHLSVSFEEELTSLLDKHDVETTDPMSTRFQLLGTDGSRT